MTDRRKVWALIGVREACDSPGDWWHEGWITSANFVDAAVLSELAEAAREQRALHLSPPPVFQAMSTAPILMSCSCRLCAALAAFDAAMLPDGETPA